MRIRRLFERANPTCKVDDLRALFDTYTYEFISGHKSYVRCPLWMLAFATDVGIGPRYSERPRPPHPMVALTIDPDNCRGVLDHAGSSIRASSPLLVTVSDDDGKPLPDNSRWPFYVDEQLQFQIIFEKDDGRFVIQEFLFEPGRHYEVETIDGVMA